MKSLVLLIPFLYLFSVPAIAGNPCLKKRDYGYADKMKSGECANGNFYRISDDIRGGQPEVFEVSNIIETKVDVSPTDKNGLASVEVCFEYTSDNIRTEKLCPIFEKVNKADIAKVSNITKYPEQFDIAIYRNTELGSDNRVVYFSNKSQWVKFSSDMAVVGSTDTANPRMKYWCTVAISRDGNPDNTDERTTATSEPIQLTEENLVESGNSDKSDKIINLKLSDKTFSPIRSKAVSHDKDASQGANDSYIGFESDIDIGLRLTMEGAIEKDKTWKYVILKSEFYSSLGSGKDRYVSVSSKASGEDLPRQLNTNLRVRLQDDASKVNSHIPGSIGAAVYCKDWLLR